MTYIQEMTYQYCYKYKTDVRASHCIQCDIWREADHEWIEDCTCAGELVECEK